jgi:hypothetical protein
MCRDVSKGCVEVLMLEHGKRPMTLAKLGLGHIPQIEFRTNELDPQISVSCGDPHLT